MSQELKDLLIVGAGPAGIAASMFASKLGLSHSVVERRSGLHQFPQAHVVKTRSLEILRRFGLEDKIHEAGTPSEDQRYTTWCTSLVGREYGRIDLLGRKGASDRFLRYSPSYPANVSQNKFEAILFERAAELSPNSFRFETECVSVESQSDHAVVNLRKDGEIFQEKAKFVIAADGAASGVRAGLGIDFEGPSALAHFCAVHVQSDFSPLTRHMSGVLYWVLNPDVSGVFIVHDMKNTQVFMFPYDPKSVDRSELTKEICEQKVRHAIGCDHPFEVTHVDTWAMSAQVAKQYRKERVIITGDAAHRFPPTGGLGLNTGLQDINNLMWKLKYVIDGKASIDLLNTYEDECRPIAQRNCSRSAENHKKMANVENAIGVSENPEAFKASLVDLFSDNGRQRRRELQSILSEQLPHFAYLDVEMAPEYETGAFGSSLDEVLPVAATVEGYSPGMRPGAGLPHFDVEPGVSSLDVISFGRFTLFVPMAFEGRWRKTIDHISSIEESVNIYAVSDKVRYKWDQFCNMENVAVLVRPDGHIGWLYPADAEDPTELLLESLENILGQKVESGYATDSA